MTRIYAGLAGLVLLVSVLAGLVAWGRQGHKSAQEAQEKAKVMATQLEASNSALRAYSQNAAVERAALTARAKLAESRRGVFEAQDKEVRNALQDNRSWSDAPIPDSVLRALDEDGVPDGADQAPGGSDPGLSRPPSQGQH